jgi:hypothetical protein
MIAPVAERRRVSTREPVFDRFTEMLRRDDDAQPGSGVGHFQPKSDGQSSPYRWSLAPSIPVMLVID